MSLITIFPMSGPNKIDSTNYYYPKPLIEINDQTMIGQAIESYISISDKFHFALNESDIEKYHLDMVVRNYCLDKNVDVSSISVSPAGALSTALLISCEYEAGNELIIANYDQYLDFSVDEAIASFRKSNLDFGCVTFNSTHPKWSYIDFDDDDFIARSAEKNPISTNALAGIYYFKDISIFKECAMKAIEQGPRSKEIFYVSEAINQFVLQGKKGKAFSIRPDQYVKFYDEAMISKFSSSNQKIKNSVRKLIDFLNSKDAKNINQYVNENVTFFANEKKISLNRNKFISTFLSYFPLDSIFTIKEIAVNSSSAFVYIDVKFKKGSFDIFCLFNYELNGKISSSKISNIPEK